MLYLLKVVQDAATRGGRIAGPSESAGDNYWSPASLRSEAVLCPPHWRPTSPRGTTVFAGGGRIFHNAMKDLQAILPKPKPAKDLRCIPAGLLQAFDSVWHTL